jgi:CRP-like cAMP-binding protein
VSTPNGDVVTLTVLGPDDTFGEVAVLGGYRHRTASIVALEPTETLVVSRRDFDALRERRPAVERFLVAVLATQVARLTAQVTEALFVPVETRLARRMCDLVSVYGTAADGATPATLVLPLTQADLASMAGTSRQTCNRILRKFAAEGVVQLDRGRTEVTDLQGLRRLAD